MLNKIKTYITNGWAKVQPYFLELWNNHFGRRFIIGGGVLLAIFGPFFIIPWAMFQLLLAVMAVCGAYFIGNTIERIRGNDE
jgi:hypothetical protein